MKRFLFIPVLLSAVPAAARTGAPLAPLAARAAAKAPAILLHRDARGVLRGAPCARIDLSDPRAFVSDDTVRAKRCDKPALQAKLSPAKGK